MDIGVLVGKTLIAIDKTDDEIIFKVSEDEQYKLYHDQDCCESVVIDDVCGDLQDLVGSPILKAEEVSNEQFEKDFDLSFSETSEWGGKKDKDGNSKPDSFTFTFYKFATIKGYVDIRFYGDSNGYYSESVDFSMMKDGEWLRSWDMRDI